MGARRLFWALATSGPTQHRPHRSASIINPWLIRRSPHCLDGTDTAQTLQARRNVTASPPPKNTDPRSELCHRRPLLAWPQKRSFKSSFGLDEASFPSRLAYSYFDVILYLLLPNTKDLGVGGLTQTFFLHLCSLCLPWRARGEVSAIDSGQSMTAVAYVFTSYFRLLRGTVARLIRATCKSTTSGRSEL